MKKKFLIVFLIFFVALLQYKQFTLLGYDITIQFISGINLSEGNGGITLPHINPLDWSDIQYKPIGSWAAGSAVMTALFNLLTDDYLVNLYMQSFIFILIFFIFLLLTLKKLRLPSNHIIIIMLFAGVCYSPFQVVGLSGLATLSACMMGIYLCLDWIEKEEKSASLSIFYLLLIGFILFLPSFFRFAYYPSGFSLLFAYLYYKVVFKKKIIFNNLLIVSFSLLFFTLLQIYYQHTLDTVNFLENNEQFKRDSFIYFENLKKVHPIALNTLFVYERWLSRVNSVLNLSKDMVMLMLNIISMSFVLLYYLLFKKTWGENNIFTKRFIIFLLIPSIFNFLFMLALSLYYPSWNNGNSTFVALERYLAPISLFLILFIAISYRYVRWSKFLFYTILVYHTLLYANSIYHYGFGNSNKQLQNEQTFSLLKDIKPILSTNEHKFILSNMNLNIYPFALKKPELAIGDLETYLKIAEKGEYHISTPIKALVIYSLPDTTALASRLKTIFGNENIKEIQREKITIWEIQLPAN